MDQIVTVGRRKTSKARVFLVKGSGLITVNKKKLDDYFGREVARMVVRQPLEAAQMTKGEDIKLQLQEEAVLGKQAPFGMELQEL